MSVKGTAVLVTKTGPPDMDLSDALTRSLLRTTQSTHVTIKRIKPLPMKRCG